MIINGYHLLRTPCALRTIRCSLILPDFTTSGEILTNVTLLLISQVVPYLTLHRVAILVGHVQIYKVFFTLNLKPAQYRQEQE